MRIAVMQPYFLPYFGYFQLMAAVDRFVILDDVNFINRGWVNRNRIPRDNDSSTCGFQWLTLPVAKASQNRLINELDIAADERWQRKTSRTIRDCYARSCVERFVCETAEQWIAKASGNLSKFLVMILRDIADFCEIQTEVVPTSSVYSNCTLRASDRILDICRQENADVYINLPGGRHLYDARQFERNGIDLQFLQPALPDSISGNTGDGFSFSFLDQLMLNSQDSLKKMMNHGHHNRVEIAA